jgi:hypothetical protein
VAREYGDWLRHNDTGDELDYCDLVQVASIYASHGHDGIDEVGGSTSVSAFKKIALSQEQTNSTFKEAQEQLDEMRVLLSG